MGNFVSSQLFETSNGEKNIKTRPDSLFLVSCSVAHVTRLQRKALDPFVDGLLIERNLKYTIIIIIRT